MNDRTFPFPKASFVLAGAMVLLTAAFTAHGAISKKKNPTSRLYVADAVGESHIHTGERIEQLTKKSAYAAEGTIIETKPAANDSLVLSNGTAIYVAPETRFEVKKFLQEPFAPNREDLEIEPSVSQTIVKLMRGSLGVCTSKMVAGSSMVYTTPHATITIRGRKVMIETDDAETRVSLIEGDITVQGHGLPSAETLKPGYQAVVRKVSPDAPLTLKIQPIPDAVATQIDDTVALACISRRTVYFDVGPGANADQDELRAVALVPANPPVPFTVSPSRIGE